MPPRSARLRPVAATMSFDTPKFYGLTFNATGAAATTTLSVTPPTNIPQGAQLFLHVGVISLTDTIDTPSGWSAQGSPISCSTGGNLTSYLFRKVATSSESSSFNVTKVGTNGTYRATMFVVTDGVFDGLSTYAATAANTAHTLAATYAPEANCLVIGSVVFRGAGNTLTWASYAEQHDAAGGSPTCSVAASVQPGAGAVSTQAVTTVASCTLAGYQIVCKPR